MRKRVVGSTPKEAPAPDEGWLDLDDLARVEVTSEDAARPVEGALLPGSESGWRAETPGEQTIRLIFDRPQRLARVLLHFVETENERTQEYVLRWSPDGGRTFHEIVRQQWNFSPPGATVEIEDHRVDIAGATVLELRITPDISGGQSRASLHRLRLA